MRRHAHGPRGSTGRRGNPCDNAKAERFTKTPDAEAVHPMARETSGEVAADLPRRIEDVHDRERLHAAPGQPSPVRFEEQQARRPV